MKSGKNRRQDRPAKPATVEAPRAAAQDRFKSWLRETKDALPENFELAV